jgi:hypothetical protein
MSAHRRRNRHIYVRISGRTRHAAEGLRSRFFHSLCAFALVIALPAGSPERVAIHLPPAVEFDVVVLDSGPVPAREPYPLAFHDARLLAGKALRVSVRLDSTDPLAPAVTFEGRAARGGTCRSGQLSPVLFVPVFESFPGVGAGGCDLLWRLRPGKGLRRAGRSSVTLRWQLESVGTGLVAALTPTRAPGPPRAVPGRGGGAAGSDGERGGAQGARRVPRPGGRDKGSPPPP